MRLIAIGKNKDRSLQQLQKEYIKRLSSFDTMEIIEVKDEPNMHTDREKEVDLIKEKEGERVLEKIKPSDWVILLDLHGKMLDSVEFAHKLQRWQDQGTHLVFVIAGSLGPSKDLVDRANFRWKLSDLTFTHLMTRILVLEQVYRAFMINHHRQYHK